MFCSVPPPLWVNSHNKDNPKDSSIQTINQPVWLVSKISPLWISPLYIFFRNLKMLPVLPGESFALEIPSSCGGGDTIRQQRWLFTMVPQLNIFSLKLEIEAFRFELGLAFVGNSSKVFMQYFLDGQCIKHKKYWRWWYNAQPPKQTFFKSACIQFPTPNCVLLEMDVSLCRNNIKKRSIFQVLSAFFGEKITPFPFKGKKTLVISTNLRPKPKRNVTRDIGIKYVQVRLSGGAASKYVFLTQAFHLNKERILSPNLAVSKQQKLNLLILRDVEQLMSFKQNSCDTITCVS